MQAKSSIKNSDGRAEVLALDEGLGPYHARLFLTRQKNPATPLSKKSVSSL